MDGIIVERIPVNRLFRKTVKFHFGMHVWLGIAEKNGIELDEFDKVDQERLGVEALFFAQDWARYKDGKKRISFEKFKKWASLIPAMQMTRIVKCMQESRVGGKTIMEIAEDGKKKQQLKK